jgi:K+-sensing histidine kinase KdpD
MLEDCIDELSGEYELRGLHITSHELPGDAYINIDPLLFRRVIINILENSIQYKTAKKVQMAIDCITSGNGENKKVIIRLADNGPGVAPENLEKIFEVFYRIEKSRNIKGSGLGLAISAKIISKMGGKIHAELPQAGGLAILISFPLVQKEISLE